jgi:hypothetical protein
MRTISLANLYTMREAIDSYIVRRGVPQNDAARGMIARELKWLGQTDVKNVEAIDLLYDRVEQWCRVARLQADVREPQARVAELQQPPRLKRVNG